MLNFNIKNLLDWQTSVLLIIFAFSIFGFLNFETDLIIKVLMVFLSFFAVLISVGREKINLLLIITYYLMIFNFYNLYLLYLWPLGVVMLGMIALSAIIFYFSTHFQMIATEKNQWLVYLVVFILVMLEIFLSLITWPIDPKGKAMILASIFYLIWGFICLEANGQFNFKKCLIYLLISGSIVTAIILTSNWYGY